MRRISCFFMGFLLIIASAGCALTSKEKVAALKNKLPSYSGPKAIISVADFEVSTAKADKDIGEDLREMLVSSLSNSNRFTIVEPGKPQDEQGQASEKQHNQLTPAELIIKVTVAEFEPRTSGGKEGLGGGGGGDSSLMGGLMADALNKAKISLDIRIVDASTQANLAATRVQNEAQDSLANLHPGLDNRNLSYGLSAYVNTPMEKAMRGCISDSARFISQNIPPNYYKY